MTEITDYSEDGINRVKSLVGIASDEKIGKECLKYDSIQEEFRKNFIAQTCQGSKNTPEHIELANAYLDYKLKLINKVTFEKLKLKYKHLL